MHLRTKSRPRLSQSRISFLRNLSCKPALDRERNLPFHTEFRIAELIKSHERVKITNEVNENLQKTSRGWKTVEILVEKELPVQHH